jgi:hypothetical protein
MSAIIITAVVCAILGGFSGNIAKTMSGEPRGSLTIYTPITAAIIGAVIGFIAWLISAPLSFSIVAACTWAGACVAAIAFIIAGAIKR